MSDTALIGKLDQLIQQLKRLIERMEHIEPSIEKCLGQREAAAQGSRFRFSRTYSIADLIQAAVMFLLLASLVYSVLSFNLSDDTRKKQLRAWVGEVPSKSFVTISDANTPVHWEVFFDNYGTTPAQNVRVHLASAKLLPGEDSFERVRKQFNGLDVTEKNNPGTVLFNSQDVENTDQQNVVVSSEEIEKIRDHSLFFVVGGKVAYNDIFGESHTYTFCRIYNANPHLGKDGLTGCPGTDEAD